LGALLDLGAEGAELVDLAELRFRLVAHHANFGVFRTVTLVTEEVIYAVSVEGMAAGEHVKLAFEH